MPETHTVFDIGMFDGADTRYFLSEGFKVVAVDANPTLIERARLAFEQEVRSGQLELVNAAISTDEHDVVLSICSDDLGSSSIIQSHLGNREITRTITVTGIPVARLFEKYGVPFYIKIDIEGADRIFVLSLTAEKKPPFLSFETGKDMVETVSHAASIGYTKFKLINQCNFRELNNQHMLRDRIARKIMRLCGYENPTHVVRKGKSFKLQHSAGPAPWVSDGRWQSSTDIISAWQRARAKNTSGWYDVHASVS